MDAFAAQVLQPSAAGNVAMEYGNSIMSASSPSGGDIFCAKH